MARLLSGQRRRRILRAGGILAVLFFVSVFALGRVNVGGGGSFGPAETVGWRQAGEHLGERVAIEGPVVGTHWAQDSQGQPTFLNIGRDYPDPDRVTIFIPGEYRARFPSAPEDLYSGEKVRVTGDLQEYEGAAEIEVNSPGQIEVIR